MPSPSDDSPAASSLNLSPHELSRLVTDSETVERLYKAFLPHPLHITTLRYYHYASQIIYRLEQELDIHQLERQRIFNYLLEGREFRNLIQPIVRDYRERTRRTRYHPYGHTPSPSFSSNTIPLPPSVYNIPDNGSYYTAIDEEPGTTKRNPIVIRDDKDDEKSCARCKQQGHQQEDCDTPMRTFDICEECRWRERRQEDCDHFDFPTPAWLKKQQQLIDERDKREQESK